MKDPSIRCNFKDFSQVSPVRNMSKRVYEGQIDNKIMPITACIHKTPDGNMAAVCETGKQFGRWYFCEDKPFKSLSTGCPRRFLPSAVIFIGMRRFEALSHALHERLPFATIRTPYGKSMISARGIDDRWSRWRLLAELEADAEYDKWRAYVEAYHSLKKVWDEERYESIVTCLAPSGEKRHVRGQAVPSSRGLALQAEVVSVPDDVEELCDECFSECFILSRVTFGELSALKRIGTEAFKGSGLTEIHVPDSVEELSGKCFYRCFKLSRITFGEFSSLKWIGAEAFSEPLA